MTYLAFHFVFTLPPILVLAVVRARRRDGTSNRRAWAFLLLLSLIALVFTTPWDNYLVHRGVWTYGPDRVVGTIGYVPVEEYLFFVLQPLLTGLWMLVLRRPEPAAGGGQARWVGTSVWVVLSLLGLLALRTTNSLYLGLILAWSGPVLAGQWAYAGTCFWRQRRLWSLAVAVPTFYLWIADRVALQLGIWHITDAYTLGLHVAGLPLEEAVFFLVTNLLVVQGLMLFLTCNNGFQGR